MSRGMSTQEAVKQLREGWPDLEAVIFSTTRAYDDIVETRYDIGLFRDGCAVASSFTYPTLAECITDLQREGAA